LKTLHLGHIRVKLCAKKRETKEKQRFYPTEGFLAGLNTQKTIFEE